MTKRIIGIFIFIMLFASVVLQAVVSINEKVSWEKKFFKNQTFSLDNSSCFLDNDSSKVLIELDIDGLAYGHELLWKANTTGTNYEESAVVYSDGIAYIGSCSSHGGGHDELFAIDTTNGTVLWKTFIGPTYVGPVIDHDRIYIGSSSHGYDPTNDYVFCINRSDGKILWMKKIFWGTPESIQYDDDNIYFAVYSIFALDKDDGTTIWEYTLDDFSATKPLLKDNAIFLATSGGTMYKVDVKNGKKIWEVSLPEFSWDNSITADDQGHIFLSIFNDRSINAYDAETGELLWRYELHGKSFSFNAYHNHVVFISDLDGYVYAINSSSGSLIWETRIGTSCDISSPTISGGLLFIGTRDFCEGAFFALNETNGDIVWKYHVGASITAPPAIANGMMLCGTDDWNMYAFDFGIGTGDWPLHRYDSSNTAFSPDGLTEWQYVSASCTTENDITTCIVKNTYDHDVGDVKLRLTSGFIADWYDNSGNLLKSDSNSFMIDEIFSQSSLTLSISDYQDCRPNTPKIKGPFLGITGKEYTYTISTVDSNNSDISYLIYWDDRSYTGWTPVQSSEEPLKVSHVWDQTDLYKIKVKVRNCQGFESQWSDPRPVLIFYLQNNPILNFLQLLFQWRGS